MKVFKKALAGVAVAATFAVASPVQASTLAIADLFINSLGLVSATGAAFDGTLTIQNELRTGTADATYNGVAAAGVGLGQINGSGAVTVDVLNRCAGDCVAAAGLLGGTLENNFTTHLAAPGTANFALGDMLIGGTALGAGVVQGLTRANAMTSSATNIGGSSASIINSGSIIGDFILGSTFAGRVAVGANYWLQAFVDSISPVVGSATAGFGWNMSVRCTQSVTNDCGVGWTTLNFIPDALNNSLSSNSFGQNALSSNGLFSASSDVRTFIEGTSYQFTINQSSNAVVTEIPEPESLALVGLGLLGLAAARRRKLA